jgi:alpha-glucosidase
VAHRCTITVSSPRLESGAAPVRPSFLLPEEPERLPLAAQKDGAAFALDGQHLRAKLVFPPGTSFYGTGEVAGPLSRRGRTTTLWNTDAVPYTDQSASLYQSHPYVLALLPSGRAVGLLADTIRRGTLALEGQECVFAFEQEPYDLYRIEGEHPLEVCRGLAALVGSMPMPPLWALGYHQCRWSYRDADELRTLAAEFRRRGIPCDALWLDIDYMERFRVFTWNRELFPDLPGLTDELRALGFRTVAILDPGIDVESELAQSGLEQSLYVQDAQGQPFVGKVWPERAYFPDFTAARAREWWAERVREFLQATRLDGLWNDMNEPAVLDGPGKTMPDDCKHEGLQGSGGSHARWHNLYGQLMVQASRAGLERARPGERPFLLTRANHVSGSRFAATWTGDNKSSWEDLRWSISMVLNLGLSGQPFSGPDVGGFNDNPNSELFTRWFELAAFLPFFRGHAEKTSRRKEPWAFERATEAHVRAAIERRMRLLPTLYTLFREAHESGAPVARPLFFADPADQALREKDDAFLLGDALLVAPIVHERSQRRQVLLPRNAGGWYAFPEGGAPIEEREREVEVPLGSVALFARAGAIVFESEPRASTAVPARLLIVHVFCDADWTAAGRLYEDEGDGHAHRTGVFRDARFHAQAGEREVVIEEEATGSYDAPTRQRLFLVHVGGKTLVAPRERAASYRIPRG